LPKSKPSSRRPSAVLENNQKEKEEEAEKEEKRQRSETTF
jgi:hypothetical protein